MISPCNRRNFLKFSATVLISGMVPLPAIAAVSQKTGMRRSLTLYNTHTSESLEVTYYAQGKYLPDAMDQINSILRDHRTGAVRSIDPKLLDVLFALKSKVSPGTPIHIISGYRSPTTNEMLRKKTNGVARTSYHIQGRAVDIRLPGYATDRLYKQCIRLNSGGVGFYPKSDFIHIDTGPVRHW